MKIAFVASLFVGGGIGSSMPYVLPVVKNIARLNGMGGGFDLFLHVDGETKGVVERVCSAEGIRTDKVNFVEHRRNMGMRGMFWRYEAFFMDRLGYDMSVILEGDVPVDSYMPDVGVFSDTGHQMMLFDARQMAVSRNCICGGYVLIRPGLVKDCAKRKLRLVMDLMDHVDDVDYGVDENVLLEWLKRNFGDEDLMIVVDDRHKTFQHIENVESEKKVVRGNFPGATIVTRDELEKMRAAHRPAPLPQIRLKNLSGDTYRLDGTDIRIGGWWRSGKSEFCRSSLMDIVDKLV
jgi:hypothetical protein